jgi:hypothetical protein
MKRTRRAPISARFLQRHITLNDAHNVRLALEIVDEGLRESHLKIAKKSQPTGE